MIASASGGVSIETLGPVTAAAVRWRSRSKLYVTVVVKVTFAIIPDGDMVIIEPAALIREELHHDNNPLRSIRATSDLAPFLPKADVVLIGHACAPHGEPVPILPVRLAVYGERTLLDKTVHVYGDRVDGFPQPFDRIPLRYERALGGPGCDENPFGVGAKAGADPDPFAANIICPEEPTRPVGFGPISRAWPSRRRLFSNAARKAFYQPIAEIADTFDWSYFQAAPVDQRIEFLRGNEWILLEGVHPDLPRFSCRLPGARAMARIYVPGPRPARQMALHADQLHINADEFLCALVCRGVLTVQDEAELSVLHIAAGLELPGQPIAWPGAPSLARGARAARLTALAPEAKVGDLQRTMMSAAGAEAAPPPVAPRVEIALPARRSPGHEEAPAAAGSAPAADDDRA
jgi:hypothetical protein